MDLNTWLAIGAILVAVIVPIAVYRWQHERQTLDYAIVGDLSILGAGARASRDKLSVKYDGLEVKEPRLVTVAVINTGNRAVKADMFENGGVRFEPKSGSLVAFEITSQEPGGVIDDSDLVPGRNHLEALPSLINPKDRFNLQLMIDGRSDIDVTARFEGQSRPLRRIEAGKLPIAPMLYGMAVWAALFGAVLLTASTVGAAPGRIVVSHFELVVLMFMPAFIVSFFYAMRGPFLGFLNRLFAVK